MGANFELLLFVCASIGTVGGAITYIWKATKPIRANKERLDTLEDGFKDIRTDIEGNNKELKNLEKAQRLQFRLLLDLTDHILTGDHLEKLEQTKTEILDYLTEV